MRPALLLASFLAVLPFISATPSPADPAQKVDPIIIPFVDLISGPTYTLRGCRSFDSGFLSPEYQPRSPAGDMVRLTVETCVDVCNLNQKKWAGVGNNSRCACGDESWVSNFWVIDDNNCKQVTCPGDNTEYCGSSSNLILYESK